MASRFPSNAGFENNGELVVDKTGEKSTTIYFVPNLKKGDREFQADLNRQVKIMEIEEEADLLRIFPLQTNKYNEYFLQPKYRDLISISLSGFGLGNLENEDDVQDLLSGLPMGFVKDYNYGLGLQVELRPLIGVLFELNLKHLIISQEESSRIDRSGCACVLNGYDFDSLRKRLDRITKKSQSTAKKVKDVAAYNSIARMIKNETLKPKESVIKNPILAKLIDRESEVRPKSLSNNEQREVVALVSNNRKRIAKSNPEVLIKLAQDIELATLEGLIEKFADMLGKEQRESYWQKLFSANPFILSLVFGYPVILVSDQAHVGGRKISGSGESITDFLVKNHLSNNSALFEIKTPAEKLVQDKPYRENIFGPSIMLTGALNQLLDQKRKFQQNIATLKHNSRMPDIESYSVQGILIIGRMPEGPEEKKSFELFRGNSKDVSIVTFDELLEKLKQLHQFLSQGAAV